MIAIIIFTTLVLLIAYYLILIPVILKNVNNKIFAFLFLAILPFGDHILGYIIFKILCFTSPKPIVYHISKDKQKQRDYWLNKYTDENWKTPIQNLRKELLLTKDLKYRKSVYVNYCVPNKKSDCKKVEDFIRKNNLQVYKFTPYNRKFIKYMKKNNYNTWYPLDMIKVINGNKLENGYINKCSPYKVKKTDFNYKFSCEKVNKIVSLLKLKNIINLPKKPYI